MEYFSPQSKIWIYFSAKEITGEKKDLVYSKLTKFCLDWTAHNKELKASFKLIDNHFIVLCVDESLNTATGCSIDKSVNLLKEISQYLDSNLFDRMLIPYIQNDELKYCHFSDISKLYENQTINDDTVFYNLNINNLADFNAEFKLPLKQHWLSKQLL